MSLNILTTSCLRVRPRDAEVLNHSLRGKTVMQVKPVELVAHQIYKTDGVVHVYDSEPNLVFPISF